MRAAVVRNFNEDLSIETVQDPDCPENGVVLEVAACGVCRSDFHGWVGGHPKVMNGSILGHEYCGTVVAVGKQAKHNIGDKLIAPFILGCGDCPACQTGVSNTCESAIVPGFGAPGAYAEFVAVPFDHNLVHLPETMSPALAAGLGCRVTTAWHALTDRANVRAGEWIAVHGTGGIGLSALLLAKMLGARVVVVDVVEEKLTHAKQLGAALLSKPGYLSTCCRSPCREVHERVCGLLGGTGVFWVLVSSLTIWRCNSTHCCFYAGRPVSGHVETTGSDELAEIFSNDRVPIGLAYAIESASRSQ